MPSARGATQYPAAALTQALLGSSWIRKLGAFGILRAFDLSVELTQRAGQPLDVPRIWTDDVDVLRRVHIAVESDRDPSDHENVDPGPVKRRENPAYAI